MIAIANTSTSTKGFTDAQVTEYLMQAYANLGIAYELRESVSMSVLPPMPTPAQAPTPTPVPERELEPAKDVVLKVTMVKLDKDDTRKAFTLGYGDGRMGAKMLIKDAGFKWDENIHAYVGDAKAYTSLHITGKGTERTLPVSAQWVQAGRDKAKAKAEKKAKRA